MQPRTKRRKRTVWAIIIIILLAVWGIHRYGSLNSRLQSAWNKVIYTSNDNVGIAVYSPKTHRICTGSNVPGHRFHMASTVKVAILAGVLVKQPNGLSDHQTSLAKEMIEQSNNDATTELFSDLGGRQGLQATFNRFGMNDSTANSNWGLSTTTPRDQIKLLNNIFYKSSLLTEQDQELIAKLMRNVEADQNWGISADSSNFAIKNGWLSYGKSKWMVNSIGYVKNDNGTDYTIAVYTDKNTTMQVGQQAVEQLARVTKSLMN
ncbi:MAG TPA: class A beta-lactamase-related serine hydrolase [Limosilactobacillus oris]|uniref:serine hydrolase n=1 Tax=Limosilactobacillus oris TaxID=1632 RepID=UPI001D2BEE14|nr:serine hydrolase [Limosilactobacillus oris]HJF46495.1 class A beta-lactamase-related serine hydrolase [Limosilactobacillus oris]